MSGIPDDIDQPTVTQQISPRARTALAAAAPVDNEPTVVVRKPAAGGAPAEANTGSFQAAVAVLEQLESVNERKLVRAAAPLLLIVAQLRNSVERADVTALRRQVVEEMDRFQQVAQKTGVDAGDIIAGRYILCSVIDETVLTTPWGSRSEWSANSLLNQYHNETWGGEKVFTILERITANAEKKLPLLILIQAALMLGFEGKYRVLERGRDLLEDLRNDLSRTIRRYSQSKPDEPLSSKTKPAIGGAGLNSAMPVWLTGIAAIAILVIVSVFTDVTLSGRLDPLVAKINRLVPDQGSQ